ncbi:MAG: O-antigen polymerase [Thermoanaerobacterium sp.]|nr:O-antigen polymerase [Thermoanaerobacterium sp.]
MVVAFFASLLILSLFLSKSVYKSYINPFLSFLGNFLLAFTIFYLVDFIDHSISLKSILIIVISFFAFVIGTFISIVQNKQYSKLIYRESIMCSDMKVNRGEGMKVEDIKIIHLFFWLSIIGFIHYLYTIQINIGILRVLKQPNLLNLAYFYENINFNTILIYMMKLSMVNSMLILLYILKFNCKKIGIYTMYFLEIIMNISVKRNIFMYILTLNFFVFMYYHMKKPTNSIHNSKTKNMKIPKKIIISISIFLIAGYYFAVTQKVLNKESIIEGTILGIRLPASIINIIMYYVGNIKSFDIYIDASLPDIPLLGATLRFLYKVFTTIHLMNYDDNFLRLHFVSVPSKFNTTLGQFYVYYEGGIIWVVIFYAIIGYISTSLYFKYQKHRNDIMLMYLALISTMLLFSIREYIVIFIDFWISIFIIIFIHLRFAKRKVKKAIQLTQHTF